MEKLNFLLDNSNTSLVKYLFNQHLDFLVMIIVLLLFQLFPESLSLKLIGQFLAIKKPQ